jgi:F-type H+-transporting ATPase subunit alpha
MEEQVVALYAGVNGFLDDIATEDVPRFQDELREHLRADKSIYDEIREKKELSDELQERLHAEVKKFAGQFAPSEEAEPGR